MKSILNRLSGFLRQDLPCLLVLLIPLSCVSEAEQSPKTRPVVQVVALVSACWQEELCMGGTVIAHHERELSSNAGGRVVSVTLREGDRFKRGDLLVRMENPSLEHERARVLQRLAQARASLSLRHLALEEVPISLEHRLAARLREHASRDLAVMRLEEGARKLEDLERLCDAGAVSREGLRSARHVQSCLEEEISLLDLTLEEGAIGLRVGDILEAGIILSKGYSPEMVIGDDGPPPTELMDALVRLHSRSLESEKAASIAVRDAALLDLEAAQWALDQLEVHASFDGQILASYVKEGALLQAGEALLSVMDDSGWDVIVQVGEHHAPQIKGGLDALCSIPSLNLDLKGSIDLISAKADRTSASFPAKIRLKGGSSVLKPGLYADISLFLPSSLERKLLPRSCVHVLEDGRGYCFELMGTQVYERHLRLGEEREGKISILSGLRSEALIVLDPPAGLEGGDHVDCEE